MEPKQITFDQAELDELVATFARLEEQIKHIKQEFEWRQYTATLPDVNSERSRGKRPAVLSLQATEVVLNKNGSHRCQWTFQPEDRNDRNDRFVIERKNDRDTVDAVAVALNRFAEAEDANTRFLETHGHNVAAIIREVVTALGF